jgi:FtsP/CotA-like multicopper oxidase with cupredoxin domain
VSYVARTRVPACVALAAAFCLVAAGCGDDGSGAAAPTTSTTASASVSGPTTATTPDPIPPASPAFTGKEVTVTVAGGKVTPSPGRVQVTKGETVRLTVTSDKAEEIHVHGYDLTKDLEAGEPGTLEFEADQTGLFEVELEKAALLLTQLVVR